jgi:uncharacterized protein YjbJ (UPF0337 family)
VCSAATASHGAPAHLHPFDLDQRAGAAIMANEIDHILVPIEQRDSHGQRSYQGIGTAGQAAVKEVIGKVTGDANLETEGKVDKRAGKVQNAIGGLKDARRGK